MLPEDGRRTSRKQEDDKEKERETLRKKIAGENFAVEILRFLGWHFMRLKKQQEQQFDGFNGVVSALSALSAVFPFYPSLSRAGWVDSSWARGFDPVRLAYPESG